MAAALEQLSSSKMFDGFNLRFRHQSATLGCAMTFSIYMPPSPASNIPVSAPPPSLPILLLPPSLSLSLSLWANMCCGM
jgi:S-formylglutathione hydrolase FrmB